MTKIDVQKTLIIPVNRGGQIMIFQTFGFKFYYGCLEFGINLGIFFSKQF